MTSDNSEEAQIIQDLFAQAIAIDDTAQRAAFLRDKCANNPTRRCELESLLAKDDPDDGFLSVPPVMTAELYSPRPFEPFRVGEYELLELLGRGGMGVVFKGQHLELKRQVAIKIMLPTEVSDPRKLARFEREIQALAEVDDHPNIVRIYDAKRMHGGLLMAMELLDGINLYQFIDPSPEHDPSQQRNTDRYLLADDACEITRQLADALHHLHEKDIVHRDVKPLNVMLTTEGKVKLLDFGLVRIWDEVASSDQLTRSGNLGAIGTPEYMAPEQWTDSHSVTRIADVYSLGCTLFFLLTGVHPFHEFSRKQQEHAHLHKAIPDINALRDVQLPSGLVDTIKRMLQKNPANRYPTAADVAEALTPYCGATELSGYATDVKEAMRLRCPPNILEWQLKVIRQMGAPPNLSCAPAVSSDSISRFDSFSRKWGTTGVPPKNLLWHGTFVGRDRQLRNLAERIRAARIVPVTGQHNAGKTSLLCKFFSTYDSHTALARDNLSPSGLPIGVCYIDLSMFQYCPFPVLRGLAMALGSAAKARDLSLSDRHLKNIMMLEVLPREFSELFPIVIFDEADEVLANQNNRDELDELLSLNCFRLACAVVAATASSVPNGKGKWIVADPVVVPDGLTPDDQTSASSVLADALGDESIAGEAVATLYSEGMAALFHPRIVAEAEALIRRNRADWSRCSAGTLVDLLYVVNDDQSIAPVWRVLHDTGFSESTTAIVDGHLSELGWLLIVAVIGRFSLPLSALQARVPEVLIYGLLSTGILVEAQGLVRLSPQCCRVLRIHTAEQVLPNAAEHEHRLFAAGVADLLNLAFQVTEESESTSGGLDEAYSWAKRSVSFAVVLIDTLSDYLVRTSFDDPIFPLERNAVLQIVSRPELEDGPWEQRLSQRIASLAAKCRLLSSGAELFSAFAYAVEAAEQVVLLQGEDLRALDLAGLTVARRSRMSDALAARERLLHRICKDVDGYIDVDVRIGKWAVSWFLNCGTLALKVGYKSNAENYISLARKTMERLSLPRTATSRADSAWLAGRFATLEGHLNPTLRRAKYNEAAQLAEMGLRESRGENHWCRRYLAAVQRLLAYTPDSDIRQRALNDTMETLSAVYRVTELRRCPLFVRAGAARLIRETAVLSADYEIRLQMGRDAAYLLESAEPEMRNAAAVGETEEILELARCWSFVADSFGRLDQHVPAQEYFTKSRLLAAVAVKHNPSVISWRVYLKIMDEETTPFRNPYIPFREDQPRNLIDKRLRDAIKAFRKWQTDFPDLGGRAGQVALWCFEREWQADGHPERDLPISERRILIQRRYQKRKGHLEWLKRHADPFPELYRALAWNEAKVRRLLALPCNCLSWHTDAGVCDVEPIIAIFAEAHSRLPDSWALVADEARFLRYIWNHREAIARFRDAVRIAPRIEEQRMLSIELSEALLTASIYAEEGMADGGSVRTAWLREAFECVVNVEEFERNSRAAAVLRDRISLELQEPLNWERLDSVYSLVFANDDYVNSLIDHLSVLNGENLATPRGLADAVTEHFTDIEVLRSFGNLLLRNAEMTADVASGIKDARRAYAAFSACRILEIARYGTEILTTRFERARALLVGVQKSGSVTPFGLALDRYASELSYAEALFQSVVARSVNDFHTLAKKMIRKCIELNRECT